MICRFCKKALVKGGEKEFETLSDHVSDPNALRSPLRATFICPDDKCLVNTVAIGFWDNYGDFYHSNWGAEELTPFKGYSGDYPAYESPASSTDTEIYKKDKNFTFYKGLKWILGVQYEYKADNNGKVIKRTPKLVITRKDFNSLKHMWEYITHFGKTEDWVMHIMHTPNLTMLKFCLDRYFKAYENYRLTQLLLAEYVREFDKDDMISYTGKRLEEYLNEVKKHVESSGQYKKWGRQSKPLDMIHGDWEWYRPLAHKIIMRHYTKHIGDKA